jgi:azurin
MRVLAVFILLLSSALAAPVTSIAADPPRPVDIVATDDMKFSVTTVTARAGEQIRIRLIVKGAMPKIVMAHNVVVLKIGTDVTKLVTDGAPHRATDFLPPPMMDSVIARTPLGGAGETVEVTFAAPAKPGRYPFICSFPGHYQAGMKGVLVVK